MSELARMAQEAQRQYEAGETEAVGFAPDGGDGMREFRFRAWDKRYRRMYANAYPFEGGVYVEMDSTDPEIIARKRDMKIINGKWFFLFILAAKDIELMPYTGIKDKNGKDIYKDDICTAEGRMVYSSSAKEMVPGRYTVYWRDDRWHLRDQNGDGYQSNDYYYADEIDWQRCTVIGNIYEQQ